jgi:hypothetical protein
MDLNLAEQAGVLESSVLASTVMDVLRQIVAPRGGPYLLVFWTQVGSRVDEVADLIRQRFEDFAKAPCPLAITSMSKAAFVTGDPEGEDFKAALKAFHSRLHENIEALREAINSAAAHDAQLSALSFWESRASEAASRAVNEVFDCVRNQAPAAADRSAMTRDVLAEIAVASGGKALAVAQPARALDAGMLDILVDQFETSVSASEYATTVASAIGESVKAGRAFPDTMKLYSDLNTFFHVDTEASGASSIDRGVVLSIDSPFDRAHLGLSAEGLDGLLTSEFLFPHWTFPKEQRNSMRELLKTCCESAEIVLVEVGADCDHAQRTDRTRRYLMALELHTGFSDLATREGRLRNGALELLGPWLVGGESRFLLVSCRRFWAWQEKEPPQGTVKYRLRAAVVDKLLHRYSSWSSRPGIVEFRPEV